MVGKKFVQGNHPMFLEITDIDGALKLHQPNTTPYRLQFFVQSWRSKDVPINVCRAYQACSCNGALCPDFEGGMRHCCAALVLTLSRQIRRRHACTTAGMGLVPFADIFNHKASIINPTGEYQLEGMHDHSSLMQCLSQLWCLLIVRKWSA